MPLGSNAGHDENNREAPPLGALLIGGGGLAEGGRPRGRGMKTLDANSAAA